MKARTSADSLDGMFNVIEPLSPLNNEIKRCILSEEEIADDASPALKSVRRSIRLTNERIRSQLNTMVNSSSMASKLQDNIITMRGGRYWSAGQSGIPQPGTGNDPRSVLLRFYTLY